MSIPSVLLSYTIFQIKKKQGRMDQFSCSVVSDSLRPHGPHHARPPCPLPTPGVYPNSCPSSWWFTKFFITDSSNIFSVNPLLHSFGDFSYRVKPSNISHISMILHSFQFPAFYLCVSSWMVLFLSLLIFSSSVWSAINLIQCIFHLIVIFVS